MKRSEATSTLPDLVKHYKQCYDASYDFRRSQQLSQLYHSTALDGNSLTLSQTALLLDTGESKTSNSQHEKMVFDYQLAQDRISDWANRHEPLNRSMIQLLGADVMRHTGGVSEAFLCDADSRKGEFRTNSLNAMGGFFERPNKLIERVNVLSEQTNIELQMNRTLRQRYETSFFVHYEFIRIHPFVEGNGRVARLLMNYIQQYNLLPQSMVYSEDRRDYQSAIKKAFALKSRKPFYDFMFSQLTKFLILPKSV